MLLLFAAAASAQDRAIAFVGATIHPVASPPIADGVLVVRGGKVVAVGARADVAVPADAEVHDLTGKVVLPGLVDTHSHVGSTGDLNEASGPLQPAVSAVDAIDPTHPSIQMAQAGGITTANLMPGSGNLVGGQTAYVKLRDTNRLDRMLFCADRRAEVCGGLKLANGTNPQGDGAYPRSRMGAATQVRNLFLAARKVRRERAAADAKRKKKDPPPDPVPDLTNDPLIEVLEGKRVAQWHTHRADDVATILSIAEEFGFRPVLHHVSEAWKVVDLLAEAEARCSVIVIDSPGGKEEAVEIKAENAAILERAGVLVALHTDDPITDSRLFLRAGGLAVRAGMTEAGALAALTLNGAKMLGLDARVGSLEPGKDADLVVLSGPPFSTWTKVEQTWVDGAVVFDRARPEDLRAATGGLGVIDRYPARTP